MSILKDFDEIYDHAHMWNWGPDWLIVKDPHEENGRNKVLHGHLHPRFWGKEDFENLIHDIAEMSQYAGF